MKIQIVGLGVVGLAQAYLSHKMGCEVFGYDIHNLQELPSYINFSTRLHSDMDINFICTQELHVEKAIQSLIENHVSGLYVIKSSTLPKTTETLSKKYQIHICHNPEFLREKYYLLDVLNPSRIIIGQCCPDHGRILVNFYEPLNRPIYVTDPTTSELVKLVVNTLRSMIITFWNEIYELATALNLNIREVADLVNQVGTIGSYEGGNWGTRFFGKKFGGKCLPKDLDNLIDAFLQHNLNPILLKAVKESNNLKE